MLLEYQNTRQTNALGLQAVECSGIRSSEMYWDTTQTDALEFQASVSTGITCEQLLGFHKLLDVRQASALRPQAVRCFRIPNKHVCWDTSQTRMSSASGCQADRCIEIPCRQVIQNSRLSDALGLQASRYYGIYQAIRCCGTPVCQLPWDSSHTGALEY